MGDICVEPIYVKTHISHPKSFNIPVSIGLTLAHMLNGYEICLNKTNCPIFNMQDFIYCLCTCNLNCFGQVVFPQCMLPRSEMSKLHMRNCSETILLAGGG